ncbi:extensin family protein [Pseudaminobacter manganicus]|uniref:Extensin family protein n=2 Tax=Manganibacter manganicus TaxID=1873176 RepID=A0A1V8RV20_9HYPH|nr:extensin family protein [Pseudaminobacter manganicus]
MAAFQFFPPVSFTWLIVILGALLLPAPTSAKTLKLPASAPIPEMNQQPESLPREPPLPQKRPAGEDNLIRTPEAAPQPPEQPKAERPEEPPPRPEAKPESTKQKPSDPRALEIPAATMPAKETACREHLKALGVEFEERKAEHDSKVGCSIPYPILVETLGASVEIKPAAELNCLMAETVARFLVDIVQPAAKDELDAEVKSVNQASAYVCRPRHDGGKISEHAFGNALDIAAFNLTDGARVEVSPVPPKKHGKFLDRVRKAACGPFKTVLGPGADSDHAQHFHLDLEPRRNGGTFCQ